MTEGARPPRPISADAAARVGEILADARRVAVDTEFHAERRYLPRLYLVQLCTDDAGPWILDPLEAGVLDAVGPTLRTTPWVVHGGQQDIRLLEHALGKVPDPVMDTQIAAGLLHPDWPMGYGRLVKKHLGHELDKGATLTDWSRRPLTEAQLMYAAEDVRLLLPLWDALTQGLTSRGRLELAMEACAEARNAALDPPPADLVWQRLPASSSLKPQQAAVLQELAAWREEVARRGNQPPRGVLSDPLLVDLARRQPLTLDSLAADRRLGKGWLRRYGPDVLERVSRAAQRPSWGWPRLVGRGTKEARALQWLYALAEAAGRDGHFGARLILPQELAQGLLLDPPADRASLAGRLGWRDALLGDLLWAALQGRVGLRLDGGDTRVEHL